MVSLLVSNLFTMIVMGNDKGVLKKKHICILILVLLIWYVIRILQLEEYTLEFIYPYFFLQFYFLVKKFYSWIVPIFFFTMQLSILTVVWVITVDLPTALIKGYSHYMTNTYVIWWIFILQNLILIVSFQILNKKKGNWNFIFYHKRKEKGLSIIFLVLFLFVCTIHAQEIINKHWIESLFTSSILVFYCFLINTYINYQKNIENLHVLSETYNYEKRKFEESSEFKHDYKALLISLSSCINDNDIVEAKKLLNQIVDTSTYLFSPNIYSKIGQLDNLPIQGLFTDFYLKCTEEQITVELNLVEIPRNLEIDNIDFIRCISILLNNSIEHTKELSGDNTISVDMKDDGNSKITLTIKNPLKERINLEEIYKKGFSTKSLHKGLGLNNIRKISKINPDIKLYLRQSSNEFIAELVIGYAKVNRY